MSVALISARAPAISACPTRRIFLFHAFCHLLRFYQRPNSVIGDVPIAPALEGVLANARRGRDPKCSASENGCRLRMEMIARQILAIVAPTLARRVRRWIFHLGGLGFVPLG